MILLVISFYFTEKPEDIHPYATFVLPEVSCGNENNQLQDYAAPKDARAGQNVQIDLKGNLENTHNDNLGTISNFDMLILHENSTLPLSDAYSKSVSNIIIYILVKPIIIKKSEVKNQKDLKIYNINF